MLDSEDVFQSLRSKVAMVPESPLPFWALPVSKDWLEDCNKVRSPIAAGDLETSSSLFSSYCGIVPHLLCSNLFELHSPFLFF